CCVHCLIYERCSQDGFRRRLDLGIDGLLAVPQNQFGVCLRAAEPESRGIIFWDCAHHVSEFVQQHNNLGTKRAALVWTYVDDPPGAGSNRQAAGPIGLINVASALEKGAVGIDGDDCSAPSILYSSGNVRSVID